LNSDLPGITWSKAGASTGATSVHALMRRRRLKKAALHLLLRVSTNNRNNYALPVR
jgi:hypothetical protein